MMLCKTGSWSAGDVIPKEPNQHAITLDPDLQGPLYQLNKISMILYNTGSWSAGDVIKKEDVI